MSEQFQTPTPTCPHCDYAMTTDDMVNYKGTGDLFAAAPDECRVCVTCPSCDNEYWIQGGYKPHYISAFSEEELS